MESAVDTVVVWPVHFCCKTADQSYIETALAERVDVANISIAERNAGQECRAVARKVAEFVGTPLQNCVWVSCILTKPHKRLLTIQAYC